MIQANFKPPHVPAISPYLIVKDVKAAIDFYSGAFGFKLMHKASENEHGDLIHAELEHADGGIFMIGAESSDTFGARSPNSTNTASPIYVYTYCSDVEKIYQKAKTFGAKIIAEPKEQYWGDKMCVIKDIDGYTWSFATQIKPCQP